MKDVAIYLVNLYVNSLASRLYHYGPVSPNVRVKFVVWKLTDHHSLPDELISWLEHSSHAFENVHMSIPTTLPLAHRLLSKAFRSPASISAISLPVTSVNLLSAFAFKQLAYLSLYCPENIAVGELIEWLFTPWLNRCAKRAKHSSTKVRQLILTVDYSSQHVCNFIRSIKQVGQIYKTVIKHIGSFRFGF